MAEATSDPLIGTQLGKGGRLAITGKLKDGGIGSVYLAWDAVAERKVAIKFLQADFSRSSEPVARFKREGKRFSDLDHPNIVKVYGLGKEHGLLYIACEFVEGRNLSEIVKSDGPFEVDRALEVCRDIASALTVAHARNVVHRDLKPDNVMIRDADGRVMLLDFGIAKPMDSGTMLTRVGAYLGTPGYSAPEQIKGQEIDQRADIFPLGVILYELVTGKLAFEERNTKQLLRSMMDRKRPVAVSAGGLPAPVSKLLRRMMQKNPARRHQDMREVIAAIDVTREALAKGGTGRDRPGTGGAFRRFLGQ